MMRCVTLCFCAAALALAPPSDPGKAGKKAVTEFAGTPKVPANTEIAVSTSTDKQSVELIFDNLAVTAEPVLSSSGQTVSQSKVFTVNIPFATDQASVKMVLDLRGFADVDSAASLSLIAHAGDTTTVVDLFAPSNANANVKAGAPVKSKTNANAAAKAQHLAKKKAKPAPPAAPATPVTEKTAEYNQRIEFTVHKQAANPVCQITLVLLAEHDTDTAGAGVALLTVDTLDLSIKTAGQAQYKR